MVGFSYPYTRDPVTGLSSAVKCAPVFSLKIETDSAAFEDDPNEELARLLEKAAQRLRAGYVRDSLRDANGNTVGSWDTGRKAQR